MENNRFIILDTHLTEALIKEGYARELVSRVQQLRKSNDFEMMDQITIYYKAPEVFESAIEEYADYVKSETLATELLPNSEQPYEWHQLNGHEVGLYITKI